MEESLGGRTAESLQRKYLEMVDTFEAQLKEQPALLDLTEGFLETIVDDMAQLQVEEHNLKAELDRLTAEHDRLKAELDLLRNVPGESASAESEVE